MKKLRWGVLGAAKIAVQKVVPAIQRSEHGRVVALASRDLARARPFANELQIETLHASYEALLADPDVDAVYIPLPNHLHAPWTIAAANAGKHVLCEKPLALSAKEAETMVVAADRAGVKLAEAFMYRLHPTWRKVRELVAGGEIGQLCAIQSWFSYFNDDARNIRNIAEYGGGALMDVGCYPVNLSRMLFESEPIRVHASARRHPQFGTDTMTTAILEFEDGDASFTCSTLTEPRQSVHVVGTKGRIDVEIPFNIPPHLPTHVHLIAGGQPPVAPGMKTFTFEPADPYGIQADMFAAAVLAGTGVPVPPSDAVANMAVIEAIVAAATS
jgi:predicted dehydrogenase